VRRKIGLVLAAILLVCGWHACCYDRVTWYGDRERGKLMANGRPFNPDAMTAASWNYPLGTKLKLIYGNKSVVVEVTDRGGVRAFMMRKYFLIHKESACMTIASEITTARVSTEA
jgi:hypothetical protein